MGLIIHSGILGSYNKNSLMNRLIGDQLGSLQNGHRDSGGAGEIPAVTTTHRLASGLLA